MNKQYISTLRDSLQKKDKILDEILRISNYQKELLEVTPLDYEKFDNYVNDKDVCIENLNKLDEGFEILYQRVDKELKENRELYAQEILQMKQLISSITEKSVSIQSLEERNRKAMEQAILQSRMALQKGKRSVSVAQNYYKSMSNAAGNVSKYMDQKQ